MATPEQLTPPPRLPKTLPSAAAERIAWLRSLRMEERGRMIIEACRLAAEIERSKMAMGLPPSKPAPWPASTWEFLRKHAPNAKR